MDDHRAGPPPGPSEMPEAARLDARSMRGVAHPLRLRLLGHLRVHGPSTATRLAAALGLNTGSTSYHLRQLAAYGYVVEEERPGSGRQRWWRAAHPVTSAEREDLGPEPEGEEAYEAFLRSVVVAYADGMERYLDQRAGMDRAWQDVALLSDWVVDVTPAEGLELRRELRALMDRYRRRGAPAHPAGAGPEERRPVSVQIQMLPHEPPPGE
ncbi:winged helix-turn-helix domain-containing protein [Rothia sp. AR01]|uniref:Winged helix-turn-helix domain-containing protein n=1 Tax=Rothia santali TaxID=2949643 RepID=A0A9X2HBC6_9MICC|nr:winged helix-turn-helix domain-containing protein [Rothia santali]MCP3425000.1 winged helix-turn-helix domain-containing protein [Rothia santali]